MHTAYHIKLYCFFLLTAFLITSCSQKYQQPSDEWVSLFNGENLDGWTIKINGQSAGQDSLNTFRVEDGIMKVNYDNYEVFDMQFGHIFTNKSYSNYILQLEYMFLGAGLTDAPHWTNLNSGVMLHAQSPQSMRIDQGFPVSIEAQFLAEGATAGTQTGNAVTPGTHIIFNDSLTTQHIIDSNSQFYPLNEWVAFEAEVYGSEEIIFRIYGEEVIRFNNPQLDETDRDAISLMEQGAPKLVGSGFIALQAEGQPIWFRNIRIKELNP